MRSGDVPDGVVIDGVHVEVNGVRTRAEAEQLGWSLAVWLREGLGLVDTKAGCEEGACGACMVQLDDAAVPACLVPVAVCDGQRVTTAGRLAADDPGGRAVAAAMEEVDSPQCTYCVGGMIVTASRLIAESVASGAAVHPDRAREALRAHLCRCGGYARHVDAVCLAAERLAS